MNLLKQVNYFAANYEIEAKFLDETYIWKGWLNWMNDYDTTFLLRSSGREYVASDLSDYLLNDTSKCFLACHQHGHYFGNLRIYEIADKVASFGRLIGDTSARNKGLGTKLVMLAQDIIFNVYGYETIIVGNNTNNMASRQSKLKAGFKKIEDESLKLYGLKAKSNEEFFMKTTTGDF
jgi:RimJ/RimL family protein N-acetyltransferase